MSKAKNKATFKRELKKIAKKNKLDASNYTVPQLFDKFQTLEQKGTLKGKADFNYLKYWVCYWWVNENF